MNREDLINELYEFSITNLENIYKYIDIGVVDDKLAQFITVLCIP